MQILKPNRLGQWFLGWWPVFHLPCYLSFSQDIRQMWYRTAESAVWDILLGYKQLVTPTAWWLVDMQTSHWMLQCLIWRTGLCVLFVQICTCAWLCVCSLNLARESNRWVWVCNEEKPSGPRARQQNRPGAGQDAPVQQGHRLFVCLHCFFIWLFDY